MAQVSFSERIEREIDFECGACGATRRATLTGVGLGRSATQAVANARGSLEEVEVFLRCPACRSRPLAPAVRHLLRQLWVAFGVLGAFLLPPLMMMLNPDDPGGRTIALGFLVFLGLTTIAATALVIHNLRLAQARQVRWH
ncbi:MAG: hypothetical protein ABL982_08295 [Vicinamibacterales bacterium]